MVLFFAKELYHSVPAVHYSHRNSCITVRVHILVSTKTETKNIFVFVSDIFSLWITNGLNIGNSGFFLSSTDRPSRYGCTA